MNEAAEPESPKETPSTLRDQLEIFKFLREESEANRAAQRDEAEANRKLLLDTAKWVSVIVSVALTIAGVLLFRDLDTFKQQLRNEGEGEAKNEIKRMDKQIDDTLQAQFGTEKIQATITSGAEGATREQAPRLIKEVITPEVKKAVDRQSGAIKDLATTAATEKVRSTIDPIAADLRVQDLILKANADDAKAFDELLEIESTGSVAQRELVRGVIADLHHKLRYQLESGSLQGCLDPGSSDFRERLASRDAQVRRKAVQDCATWFNIPHSETTVNGLDIPPRKSSIIEFQVVPEFVDLALADSSLWIRATTINALSDLFKSSPRFPRDGLDLLNKAPLKEWWRNNAPDYRALILISQVYAGPENADSKDLYDEISGLEAAAPPPLRSELGQALIRMRTNAAESPVTTDDYKRLMAGETCERVTGDFGLRWGDLAIRPGSPKEFIRRGYGYYEIELLKSCPAFAAFKGYMRGLVEVATTSPSLSVRYSATTLINKWTGASLDSFDEAGIQAWWGKHQSEYRNPLGLYPYP